MRRRILKTVKESKSKHERGERIPCCSIIKTRRRNLQYLLGASLRYGWKGRTFNSSRNHLIDDEAFEFFFSGLWEWEESDRMGSPEDGQRSVRRRRRQCRSTSEAQRKITNNLEVARNFTGSKSSNLKTLSSGRAKWLQLKCSTLYRHVLNITTCKKSHLCTISGHHDWSNHRSRQSVLMSGKGPSTILMSGRGRLEIVLSGERALSKTLVQVSHNVTTSASYVCGSPKLTWNRNAKNIRLVRVGVPQNAEAQRKITKNLEVARISRDRSLQTYSFQWPSKMTSISALRSTGMYGLNITTCKKSHLCTITGNHADGTCDQGPIK
jgi:hypothetical protein